MYVTDVIVAEKLNVSVCLVAVLRSFEEHVSHCITIDSYTT